MAANVDAFMLLGHRCSLAGQQVLNKRYIVQVIFKSIIGKRRLERNPIELLTMKDALMSRPNGINALLYEALRIIELQF